MLLTDNKHKLDHASHQEACLLIEADVGFEDGGYVGLVVRWSAVAFVQLHRK